MFGLFGKKNALKQLAANIATMINFRLSSLRVDNAGSLPGKISTDKFFLGYIYGVASGGIHVFGLSVPEEKVLVMVEVYDLFFPGKGMEMMKQCTKWASDKEEEFLRAVNVAIRESSTIYKAMAAGDENAVKESVGALKTLDGYISENYLRASDNY